MRNKFSNLLGQRESDSDHQQIHSPYGRQYRRDIKGFLRIRLRKVA